MIYLSHWLLCVFKCQRCPWAWDSKLTVSADIIIVSVKL